MHGLLGKRIGLYIQLSKERKVLKAREVILMASNVLEGK